MMVTQILYALFSLVSMAMAFHPLEKLWQNSEYEKTVDLSKSFIKERHDISALNTFNEPLSKYTFGIPRHLDNEVSLLIGMFKDTNGKTSLLKSNKLDIYDDDILYYNIELPYPISPGSTFKFSVSTIIINQYVPYPEHIPMNVDQVLKLSLNAYPLSPYDTMNYSLGFISGDNLNELNSNELPFPLETKDSTKSSALYQSNDLIPSNSVFDLSITFTKISPLIYVNNLTRDLWISHWSNSLQLEEYYEVTNHGAKLDKGFSRADYYAEKLMFKPHHAITAFRIPFDSTKDIQNDSIYFVDKVGNVSTSQYYENELILRPRFPIFGGWNYNFTTGWNYNLNQFIKKESDDTYILRAHILQGIFDSTYGNIDLNIYLPEGAELLDYALPFVSNDPTTSYEYSYLDIEKGHLKISFNFDNIVDEMKNLEVIIRYKYSTYNMIKKPLKAAFYIFLALMGLYLLKKIDLSIKPTKNGELISESIDDKQNNIEDDIVDVNDE